MIVETQFQLNDGRDRRSDAIPQNLDISRRNRNQNGLIRMVGVLTGRLTDFQFQCAREKAEMTLKHEQELLAIERHYRTRENTRVRRATDRMAQEIKELRNRIQTEKEASTHVQRSLQYRIQDLKDEVQLKDKELDEMRRTKSGGQCSRLCEEAQARYLKLEKENRKISEDMLNLRGPDIQMLDDAHFHHGARILRNMIEIWSSEVSKSIPLAPDDIRVLDSRFHGLYEGTEFRHPYSFLGRITPRYFEYTSVKEGMQMILQAYVWNVLVRCIFENKVWPFPFVKGKPTTRNIEKAGKHAEAFRLYFELGKEDRRNQDEELHKWRSITSRLLLKKVTYQFVPPFIDLVQEACLSEFQKVGYKQDVLFHVEYLREIAVLAMELAGDMVKQRAYLKFEYINRGAKKLTEFKSGYVTSHNSWDNTTRAGSVILTVEPALAKYGTCDGTDFHIRIPILKATVHVEAIRRY
ncbi:hypothetical protein B7494_g7839 [Chlorociboria aeruginascens]|nr:hypothetical protein B7494_g7839 [Chlorociboria aeruginascens]